MNQRLLVNSLNVVDDLIKEHLNFNDLDKKIKKQILSKVNKDVTIMIKNNAFGVN